MTTTEINGTATKTLTKEEQATLWAALDDAQANLEAAHAELAACREALSEAATAIVTATGKTGFIRNGQPIKFVKRKKTDLYSVRGVREELEAVDV
jgi:hypothetical protein